MIQNGRFLVHFMPGIFFHLVLPVSVHVYTCLCREMRKSEAPPFWKLGCRVWRWKCIKFSVTVIKIVSVCTDARADACSNKIIFLPYTCSSVCVREWENKYRTTPPKIQNILFRSLSSTVQHITHSTRSYIFRIFGVLCCRRTPLKKNSQQKISFPFFPVRTSIYVRVCVYIYTFFFEHIFL